MYLNGSTTPLVGTGYIPASASQNWTTYDRVVIGEFELVQGENTLTFSFTPVKEANGGNGAIYNFVTLSVIGEGKYDWAKHVCDDACDFCGKCTSTCTESECAAKCTCGKTFTFNGMDEEIVVTGYPKNETEQCIAGRNNIDVVVTFTINASKAGTYKLYLNNSANTNVVALNKTFALTVNGTSYVSTENGHSFDSSRASSTYFDYVLDYYGEIQLNEGNNVIVLTILDDNKLAVNVKDIIFVGPDSEAVLTYGS